MNNFGEATETVGVESLELNVLGVKETPCDVEEKGMRR
jgi:hypothetical protein